MMASYFFEMMSQNLLHIMHDPKVISITHPEGTNSSTRIMHRVCFLVMNELHCLAESMCCLIHPQNSWKPLQIENSFIGLKSPRHLCYFEVISFHGAII